MSSDKEFKNDIKFTDNSVIKYSPKNFMDCSIELEYTILNHLNQCGVKYIPKIINYKFGSRSFIEMTRLFGCLLEDYLNQDITEQEAYYVFINCLYALAELHEHGVTHGDIHGENIILINTDQEENIWNVNNQTIKVLSMGKRPVYIDYGLSYLQESNFKSDLSITYSGIVTSCCPDQIIDIIHLITTMESNIHLSRYLKPFIKQFDDDYLQVDLEIINILKSMPQTKRWQFKFLTAELFNILRCFPYNYPITNQDQFDRLLTDFLKFLTQKSRYYKPFKFYLKIKSWYFKQKHLYELSAGSAVINYIIETIVPKIKEELVAKDQNRKYFTNTLEAIDMFKKIIGSNRYVDTATNKN